jgi:hypothetical protein
MKRRGALVVLLLVFAMSGCTNPDSVAQFCSSATSTLSSAGPVFADMKQSCLREVASRADFGTFTFPPQDDPGCTAIGKQAAGAQAAVQVLADYYSAMNDLASFGSTKAGADAEALASQVGNAFGADSPTQNAVGSIAHIIVSASTSRYQRKHLEQDLTTASGNITQVNNALIKIIRDDYIGRLLDPEEKKVTIRYKDFAKNNPNPAVTLLLDDRWQADERIIRAKRASAQSLISALDTLSKGTADLAANSSRMNTTEIIALLEPYVAQLKNLLPLIERGF